MYGGMGFLIRMFSKHIIKDCQHSNSLCWLPDWQHLGLMKILTHSVWIILDRLQTGSLVVAKESDRLTNKMIVKHRLICKTILICFSHFGFILYFTFVENFLNFPKMVAGYWVMLTLKTSCNYGVIIWWNWIKDWNIVLFIRILICFSYFGWGSCLLRNSGENCQR